MDKYTKGGIVAEKDLKVGMKGKDYNDEPGIILAIAKVKDFDKIKKWDHSGAMQEGIDEEWVDADDILVAVKDESGQTAVFTYGYDGFYVENDSFNLGGILNKNYSFKDLFK